MGRNFEQDCLNSQPNPDLLSKNILEKKLTHPEQAKKHPSARIQSGY